MNNECLECVEPKWNNDPVEQTDSDDGDDDDDEKLVSFYRWGKAERTQKICVTMNKDETWETWREVIHCLKCHIHRKRQQVGT